MGAAYNFMSTIVVSSRCNIGFYRPIIPDISCIGNLCMVRYFVGK